MREECRACEAGTQAGIGRCNQAFALSSQAVGPRALRHLIDHTERFQADSRKAV